MKTFLLQSDSHNSPQSLPISVYLNRVFLYMEKDIKGKGLISRKRVANQEIRNQYQMPHTFTDPLLHQVLIFLFNTNTISQSIARWKEASKININLPAIRIYYTLISSLLMYSYSVRFRRGKVSASLTCMKTRIEFSVRIIRSHSTQYIKIKINFS